MHTDKPEEYPRVLPISAKTDKENRKAERGPAMYDQMLYTREHQDQTMSPGFQSTVPGATVIVTNMGELTNRGCVTAA